VRIQIDQKALDFVALALIQKRGRIVQKRGRIASKSEFGRLRPSEDLRIQVERMHSSGT